MTLARPRAPVFVVVAAAAAAAAERFRFTATTYSHSHSHSSSNNDNHKTSLLRQFAMKQLARQHPRRSLQPPSAVAHHDRSDHARKRAIPLLVQAQILARRTPSARSSLPVSDCYSAASRLAASARDDGCSSFGSSHTLFASRLPPSLYSPVAQHSPAQPVPSRQCALSRHRCRSSSSLLPASRARIRARPITHQP